MEDSAEAAKRARDTAATNAGGSRPFHQRVASVPAHMWNQNKPTRGPVTERTALVRRHSIMGETGAFSHDLRYVGSAPVAGGTVLGIHNLAIVFPQFLVCASPLQESSLLMSFTMFADCTHLERYLQDCRFTNRPRPKQPISRQKRSILGAACGRLLRIGR